MWIFQDSRENSLHENLFFVGSEITIQGIFAYYCKRHQFSRNVVHDELTEIQFFRCSKYI